VIRLSLNKLSGNSNTTSAIGRTATRRRDGARKTNRSRSEWRGYTCAELHHQMVVVVVTVTMSFWFQAVEGHDTMGKARVWVWLDAGYSSMQAP
jgi:hypothetical protein